MGVGSPLLEPEKQPIRIFQQLGGFDETREVTLLSIDDEDDALRLKWLADFH